MNNVLFVCRRIRDIHERTRPITSPNAAGRTFTVPSLSRPRQSLGYSSCWVFFSMPYLVLMASSCTHPAPFSAQENSKGTHAQVIHLFSPLLRLQTSSLLRRISAIVPRRLLGGGCSACGFGLPRPCSRSCSRPSPCPRVLMRCRRSCFKLVSRLWVLLRSLRCLIAAVAVRLRLGFGLKRRRRPPRAQKLRRVPLV